MSTPTRRLSVTLAPHERTAIRDRAKAHGVSMAAFIRASALGERPTPGAASSAHIDEWWESLPATRREQVYRWLTAPGVKDAPIPGQTALDITETSA